MIKSAKLKSLSARPRNLSYQAVAERLHSVALAYYRYLFGTDRYASLKSDLHAPDPLLVQRAQAELEGVWSVHGNAIVSLAASTLVKDTAKKRTGLV